MGEVTDAQRGGEADLISCPDCDLLLRLPPVRGRAEVHCTRCDGLLYASYPQTINHTLALTVTALILFILANSFPFLTMNYHGIQTEATLVTGIMNLFNQGYALVALLVGLTSWLIPLAELSILLYILLPIRLGWVLPGTRLLLRGLTQLRPWSMSEVYLLGDGQAE
jgi:paraquat-inducible protein A